MTRSAATLPEAPGLFSTTTDCPSRTASASGVRRASRAGRAAGGGVDDETYSTRRIRLRRGRRDKHRQDERESETGEPHAFLHDSVETPCRFYPMPRSARKSAG